jgi:hypothetical protein
MTLVHSRVRNVLSGRWSKSQHLVQSRFKDLKEIQDFYDAGSAAEAACANSHE